MAKYLKERATEAIKTNRETSLVQRYSDFFLKRESSIAQPEDGWRLMYDFFTAGVNTVPEVITWDIYYLASDLDLQDKVKSQCLLSFVGIPKMQKWNGVLSIKFSEKRTFVFMNPTINYWRGKNKNAKESGRKNATLFCLRLGYLVIWHP